MIFCRPRCLARGDVNPRIPQHTAEAAAAAGMTTVTVEALDVEYSPEFVAATSNLQSDSMQANDTNYQERGSG